MFIPHKELAQKSIRNTDGTTYTYDESGYVEEVIDQNGNVINEIFREPDGNVVVFL